MRKTILLSAIGLTLALSGAAFAGDNDGKSRHAARTEKSRTHDEGKNREIRSDRRDHRDGEHGKAKSAHHDHRDADNDGDRKYHGDRRG
jgi:hypothetical protein